MAGIRLNASVKEFPVDPGNRVAPKTEALPFDALEKLLGERLVLAAKSLHSERPHARDAPLLEFHCPQEIIERSLLIEIVGHSLYQTTNFFASWIESQPSTVLACEAVG